MNYTALPTVTEYVRTSSNSACISIYAYRNTRNYYENSNTHNWIYNIAQNSSGQEIWLLTPYSQSNSETANIQSDGSIQRERAYTSALQKGVTPVVYLKSDITLLGEGTSDEPYTINS